MRPFALREAIGRVARMRRSLRLPKLRGRGQKARSSLIAQLLTLQLAIVAAVGLLALAGLYWTSRTVIDENLTHWATQWARELNELGAPFYLSNTGAAVVDVERFTEKYPEIAAVTWYGPDGAAVPSLNHGVEPRPLPPESVARLAELVGKDSPYSLTEKPGSPLEFSLAGPIWSEAAVGDTLLDVGASHVDTKRRLLGFVAVDLDYSWYHRQFLPKLWVASLALLALLGASWIIGHRLVKRALSPLAALQEPLANLASGELEVTFPASEHAEIHSIVKALEDTTVALHERDRRLVHLAMHDSLTGLYNRHRFVTELEQEIVEIADDGHRSAVLFVDLDQFKYVNDTCGHPAGDELLKLAARCIGSAVRATDIVARFGGDEFAVLLKDVLSAAGAVRGTQDPRADARADARAGRQGLFAAVQHRHRRDRHGPHRPARAALAGRPRLPRCEVQGPQSARALQGGRPRRPSDDQGYRLGQEHS